MRALRTHDEIKQITGFRMISEESGPQMGIFAIGCLWELDNDDAARWRAVVADVRKADTPVEEVGCGPTLFLHFRSSFVLASEAAVLYA